MDREKILKALECLAQHHAKCSCGECEYWDSRLGYDECERRMAPDIIALLKEQEAVKPQDAEMLIIHNGGAKEYVKDIESIVLLAHKDYDIVYCGKFSEGR